MAKYLNDTGLSHLMTKLKTWAAATFAPLSHTHDYTKTRVKGNAESSYRTGDVNLTYANLGTAPIANGGTGATTAAAARKNIGLGDIGYYDGYIRTQPENTLPVIIPFVNNDIAFLLKRGGSAVVKYDGVVQSVSIANVFDGSPSYWGITSTGITEVVIELTLHKVFAWGNTLYIDFGPWYTKTIKVEVMNSGSSYPNDTWTEKFSTTTNTKSYITANVTHTPVGASNSGAGFNKVRLTFSFANGAYSSSIFRIAQIGILNYGSLGLREPYMSRGIDDSVLRSITPANTSTYSLGSSSLYWANLYANTIYSSKIASTVQVGTSTQSTIANAGIKVNDVRNATLTNNMLDQAANFYFTNSGTPNTNWWGLLHVKGWTGGYSAWELAGPAHNSDMRTTPLYVRTGNASNTWGSWRKIYDESNKPTSSDIGAAPTSHASSATTYGAGSSSNYGHVKLSDSTSSSSGTSGGIAATPSAVKAAYDLASGANTTAGNALSAATGALAFKVTYSISNGDVVCAAHVYSAGSEVTNDHDDSCFAWSMSLDGGATWTSLGTGKTKTVSAMSTYGGNVKCDFTPAS